MRAVQPRFLFGAGACCCRGRGRMGCGAEPSRWIHAASPRTARAQTAGSLRQLCNSSVNGREVGMRHAQAMALTRAASRETLRAALRLWTTPFCAVRTKTGSAAARAWRAAALSPAASASSTLRTCDLNCERRDLLISVRRIILRVAFLAEVVLAIGPPPMKHVVGGRRRQAPQCGCYRPSQLAGSTTARPPPSLFALGQPLSHA